MPPAESWAGLRDLRPGRSHLNGEPSSPTSLAGQFERVLARDPDTERGLAQPPQAAVQRPVPRRIGPHVRPEVGAPQGGQDAGERDPARMVAGRVGHPIEQEIQFAPERGEWPTSQQGVAIAALTC